MGEPGSSDTWKKLVIAKTNNQWVSISSLKTEQLVDDVDSAVTAGNLSIDYEQNPYQAVKTKCFPVPGNKNWQTNNSSDSPDPELDPLMIVRKEKPESSEERASRLAKMSAYAAQRLANETPEQRAVRLKRMSEYAGKRLASETSEQRAKRLARMSAYAAKRLAQETPDPELDPLMIVRKEKPESSEERASRLAKMSAYAAQRLANETPEQRAIRLKRMSEYAAKRLASETSEQRAKRLARMSAYAAKRLAQETPEQRQARLTRMSAYAAKRHSMKKVGAATAKNSQSKNNYNVATKSNMRQKPNQS